MTDLGLSDGDATSRAMQQGIIKEAGPKPCLYKLYENEFQFYLVEMTRKRVCSQNLAGLRIRR